MKKETTTPQPSREVLQEGEKWEVDKYDDICFKIWSNTGNNSEKFICEIENKERAELICDAVNERQQLLDENKKLIDDNCLLNAGYSQEIDRLRIENKQLLDSNRELKKQMEESLLLYNNQNNTIQKLMDSNRELLKELEDLTEMVENFMGCSFWEHSKEDKDLLTPAKAAINNAKELNK